jgi:pimeloyl-ACP methyl ester carboxylesterase
MIRGRRRESRHSKRPALIPAIALICLTACAPAEHLDAFAAAAGLQRVLVLGTHFEHVVYRNHWQGTKGTVLHVYLEGDGLPWITRHTVSADPTPRDPLALRLMCHDSAPSIYLGRPCYNGQASAPGCVPEMWTSGRYGPLVVASMQAALERILAAGHFDGLLLIGYSGGGAVAMLLAARIPETRGVITIAGNLDIQRWATLHGYSMLEDSINPADEPPLRRTIRQVHYVGALDMNVPPALVRAAVARQPQADVVVVQGFDHGCCWEAAWSGFLEKMR